MLNNNIISIKNRINYDYTDKRTIEAVNHTNRLSDDYEDITFNKTNKKEPIVVIDSNIDIKALSGENTNIIYKICIIDNKIIKIKELRYEIIGGKLDA